MSILLSVRRWLRPDQPQPNYKAALGTRLWEAPLYVPIGDLERDGRRTADRPTDRTYILQTVPAFSWVEPVVERIVGQWGPAFVAERACVRTGAPTALDVRRVEGGQPAWIFSAVPVAGATTAQQWPAIHQNTGLSYRSLDRVRLDVRGVDWFPAFGWLQPAADAVTRTWIPVFDAELAAYRSGERARLDSRGHEQPRFDWVQSAADSVIRTWAPVFTSELAARRSDDRARLDVRAYEWTQPAWIFTNLPGAVTIAQQWPAILQNLPTSYRVAARALLDVRGSEWFPESGWLAPAADAVTRTWGPAFAAALATYRSREAPRLDVRTQEWTQPTWPYYGIPVAGGPTTAQTWPALLVNSYRTDSRAQLDVRRVDAPEQGWIPQAADRTTSTWAPVFRFELSAFRSTARPPLDLTRQDAPLFDWVQPVVDAIIAKWSPVFDAQHQTRRTPDRVRLEVVRYEWRTGFGWVTLVTTIPPSAGADVVIAVLASAGIIDVRPDGQLVQIRPTQESIRVQDGEIIITIRPDDTEIEP